MKISEVIKKLQEIQADKWDIEVLALENKYGDGEFVSLKDGGISFDRYNEGENVLYIGW